MTPFHEWRSTDSRLEPLRGGSLLFISKFTVISIVGFEQVYTGRVI